MADIRIQDLTQITPVGLAEDHNVALDNAGGTRRMTIADLRIGLATHSVVAVSGEETVFDYTATVNKAAGDYVAWGVDVTETSAPGSNNRLADLKVGGASRFRIQSDGAMNPRVATAAEGGSRVAQVALLTTTGTGAAEVGVLVSDDNDPNGNVTSGAVGSLLLRAGTAAAYLKTAGPSTWTDLGTTPDPLLLSAGTAAAAAYSFSGSAGDGIYQPAAGMVGITTDGVLAVSVEGTLDTATGDETAFAFTSTVNKATSGDYTGILLNITETAAPGTDNRLLDLQVGGASQAYIQSDGKILASPLTVTNPGFSFVGDENTGFTAANANQLSTVLNGVEQFRFLFAGSSSQLWFQNAGSASNPNLANWNDDTGVYLPGSSVVGITANGSAVALFAETGFTTAGTLDTATGDETAHDISVTVNKATSGNYKAINLNVTETAAPGSDNRLLELSVGGTPLSWFKDTGALVLTGGTAAAPGLVINDTGDGQNDGFYSDGTGRIGVTVQAIERSTFGTANFVAPAGTAAAPGLSFRTFEGNGTYYGSAGEAFAGPAIGLSASARMVLQVESPTVDRMSLFLNGGEGQGTLNGFFIVVGDPDAAAGTDGADLHISAGSTLDSAAAGVAGDAGSIEMVGGQGGDAIDGSSTAGAGGSWGALGGDAGNAGAGTGALGGSITIEPGVSSNGTNPTVDIALTNAGRISIGNGSGQIGFFGNTPASQPTVSGSRSSNAALADLLTELETLGLIVDSTT